MKRKIKMIFLRIVNYSKGVRLGRTCNIAKSARFEGYNVIHDGTEFVGSMGYASYIGYGCDIQADIGRYCCIANHVITAGGKHPVSKFVSIHPAFYSSASQSGFSFSKENLYDERNYINKQHKTFVKIENDVWIGSNVTLLGGITIGNGAVVGAGAVVTHDVAPYEIVVGNPARVIKKRFTDEQIEFLLKDKWWEKDVHFLSQMPEYFTDIKKYEEYMDEFNLKDKEK